MFNDLTVGGYVYNSLAWAIVPPAQTPRGPRGFRVDHHLWAGGAAEATLPAQVPGGTRWSYAVKLDTSAQAVEEARLALRDQPAFQEEAAVPLGVARIKRFEGDADEPLEGERRVPLEGLDEAHLTDRLTTAILTWHAELHGEGPLRAAVVA